MVLIQGRREGGNEHRSGEEGGAKEGKEGKRKTERETQIKGG